MYASKTRVFHLLLSSLCVNFLWVSEIDAQAAGRPIRDLNNEVLRLRGEMQRVSAGEAAELRRRAVAAISARASELKMVIERDPAQALSIAFAPDLLADLAAKFPEAASQLESHGTWSGPVNRWIMDYRNGSSLSLTRMRAGDQTLDLYFSRSEPAGCQSGDVLEATGVRVDSKVAVSEARLQPRVLSSTATTPSCSTTGAQNTAVLLAVPQGVALPTGVTQASVYNAFFGTANASLDGYWRETSSGKTWLTGDVFGPYILGTYSCSNLDQLQSDAYAAATAAGVNLPNYTRIFLIYPNLGCNNVEGVATIGCQTQPYPTGSFIASQANILADSFTSLNGAVSMAAHEGGHNLGLAHARSRGFAPDVVGPLGSTGTLTEYGDMFSAMGPYGIGHYAAQHKSEILSWLAPGSDYQVVQSGGTWTLQPVETGSGLRALKVQRGTGNSAWLWIEYRQQLGNYDSTLNSQAFGGALIHYEDSQTGTWSDLLDFTPATVSWLDSALVPGQPWVDPYTNVSITVQSATSAGLTVTVSYGANSSCTHANPQLTISPADPSVSPGSSVNYAVSVTNHDSSACPASTFGLASTQPTGWTGSFSNGTFTLSPSQTTSTTLTESVPSGTPPGTYTITGSAASNSYTGSATVSSTVTSVPVLSDRLSVPGSTYSASAHQTISFTATVTNGTTPVSRASVTFTMTKANGSKVTGTATTNSTGQAVWSYRLAQKDPAGTYSAVSTAAAGSQSATSNTATFTVQ